MIVAKYFYVLEKASLENGGETLAHLQVSGTYIYRVVSRKNVQGGHNWTLKIRVYNNGKDHVTIRGLV